MGSEALNYGYRNHAWDNLSFLIVLSVAGVVQKHLCTTWNRFTFKISDLFSLSIDSDIPMVRNLLVESWMNAAPLFSHCQICNHLDLYQYGIVTLCSSRIRSHVDFVAYT